jgi:RNA polymerase sigma-70 factor (ECF subfamily)
VRKTEAELEEERQLVEAAQRDLSAFQKLYDRYFDQIYSYVYYHCGSREQAEDITAATFQRALETLPNFHWRGVPYSAWLYRVASNMLSRDRRHPAMLELKQDAPIPAHEDEPDIAWLQQEATDELHAAIRTLPPDQRQAILLRFFAGMRNKEIGSVMNRTEGAVKLLVFRGVSNLRRQLREEPG